MPKYRIVSAKSSVKSTLSHLSFCIAHIHSLSILQDLGIHAVQEEISCIDHVCTSDVVGNAPFAVSGIYYASGVFFRLLLTIVEYDIMEN